MWVCVCKKEVSGKKRYLYRMYSRELSSLTLGITVRCTGLVRSGDSTTSGCSDGRLLPVSARGWLGLLLACLWLLFSCFCLRGAVSRWLDSTPTPLRLLFLGCLWLRLGSLQLEQAELHAQFDDGLSLFMDCLIQMIVLYLEE